MSVAPPSTYWLAHSGIAVAGRTPRPVRHALASGVTSVSYLGWRSKRLVTRENMAVVLGLPASHPLVRRTALRSWVNYGRTASALICLPQVDIGEVTSRIEDRTDGMPWREALRLAREPGRGVLITTGHVGSWDLAGAIAAREVPLSAVADTFKDPRLNRLLQGHREDKNVGIIPVSAAPRRALEELRANRAVAIVADRPVPRERGVAVQYFGRTAYVPAGSAVLALRSGAAIMPGYVWYGPGQRYYLRAFPPVFPREATGAEERTAEIQRLTQYMFHCQEAVVRECPAQWFMFRRFWPADHDEPGAGAPSGGADRRTSSTRTAPRTPPDGAGRGAGPARRP